MLFIRYLIFLTNVVDHGTDGLKVELWTVLDVVELEEFAGADLLAG
tara:strand:+ start:4720 stop:4857 length:138 start_codon:yes stop_codon:yes gene_type:complete